MGKETPRISDSEMEAMRIFWADGGWITVHDVLDRMPDNKKWKYNTVATFVLRLTEKGFLRSRKNGWTNEYTPAVTEREYRRRETEQFIDEMYHGSYREMFSALYQDKLSESELDELLTFLEGR